MSQWLFWPHACQGDLRDNVSTGMRGLVPITWGLITVVFAIVAGSENIDMLFVTGTKQYMQCGDRDPSHCAHTRSQVPKANTSAYFCLGF